MPYDLLALVADVAQVQNDRALFGSGRLIGRNLVLTAAHVTYAYDGSADAAGSQERRVIEDGWQIRFEHSRHGGSWPWHQGKVVWFDPTIDLALIQVVSERNHLEPRLALRIADIQTNAARQVSSYGYPRASKEDTGPRKLIPMSGKLQKLAADFPLRLAVEQSDLPNHPHEDWSGMSGSAVCRLEPRRPEQLWIYGASKGVPANFDGVIEIAPLASAWQDNIFREVLNNAGVPANHPTDPEVDICDPLQDYARQESRKLSSETASGKPRHIGSQLDHYFDTFCRRAPWHITFKDKIGELLPSDIELPDDLDNHTVRMILMQRARFENYDCSGPYRELKSEIIKAIKVFDAKLRGARQKAFKDRSLSAERLQRVHRFLKWLSNKCETFLNEIENTPFYRCFAIAGGIGSGKTQVVYSQMQRSLAQGIDRPFLVHFVPPANMRNVHAAVLARVGEATKCSWQSLDELNDALNHQNIQIALVLEDFDGIVRNVPDSVNTILNLVAEVAHLHKIFWIFTFLDTNLGIMARPLEVFREFGQRIGAGHKSAGEKANHLIVLDGTLMLDSINELNEVGLKIVKERLSATSAPPDFFENIDERAYRLLCNPMLAQVYSDFLDEMPPLSSLHYIDLIETLKESRIRGCSPELRETIRALLAAIGRQIFCSGSLLMPVREAERAIATHVAGLTPRHGLDMLTQVDLLCIPQKAYEIGWELSIVQLKFDLIWQDCLSGLLLEDLVARSAEDDPETVESAARAQVGIFDDAWTREGIWQLLLLHADCFQDKTGRGAGYLKLLWDRTAAGIDASADSAMRLPWYTAYQAGVHASEPVVLVLMARLLKMKRYPMGRQATFVLIHFAFITPAIQLKERARIAARLSQAIKEHNLERYFFYCATNAVEKEGKVEEIFRALHFLSGIEKLPNCEAIVEAFWLAICDIMLGERNYLKNIKLRMIEYLRHEAKNVYKEYEAVSKKNIHGKPHFVRQHVIVFFCKFVLDRCEDAHEALAYFDSAEWFQRNRADIEDRVLREMRRTANLEFGRWFRRRTKGSQGLIDDSTFVQSYIAMLNKLIDQGNKRPHRTELAFFLLRHTSVPDEFQEKEAKQIIAVDPRFSRIFARLSSIKRIRHFFCNYPIRVK